MFQLGFQIHFSAEECILRVIKSEVGKLLVGKSISSIEHYAVNLPGGGGGRGSRGRVTPPLHVLLLVLCAIWIQRSNCGSLFEQQGA